MAASPVMAYTQIIQRTLRVPRPTGAPGDGSVATRQLDAALLSAGFGLTAELRAHLAGLEPYAVVATGRIVLGAVRTLVGAHVAHNVYFRDFPENVPDTLEFWTACLVEALTDPGRGGAVIRPDGPVNLLDLPSYGRYRHTYDELAAARDAFVASAKDRFTLLHLGRTLEEETRALYEELAGSTVPLGEDDLVLLARLASVCADQEPPSSVPIRENRAVVNRAGVASGRPPLADTVTDVLRLACALSDGDVTLDEPTRFRSFSRRERRALLNALDAVVAADPTKLGDVARHREPFKRLAERLHPHEYPRLTHAREVFAVARGDRRARTFDARVEAAFSDGDIARAVAFLASEPGRFVRSLDRILSRSSAEEARAVAARLDGCADRVAPRVLVSAREHLAARAKGGSTVRLFVNRKARTWVEREHREPLPADRADPVIAVLDDAVARRLPRFDRVFTDEAVRTVAVPRSGKGTAGGVGVLPRGSAMPVTGDHLRFFVHWRQTERRTDLDLSVQKLDADFAPAGQVSWTNLRSDGMVHSGDIVNAPEGATEMIDLNLAGVDPRVRHVVPQVLLFCGEGFTELAESFFGFMTRDGEQDGLPFEPRTVRFKSDLRGSSRVALPLMFSRGEDGRWTARWLHLFLPGRIGFNRVEETGVSASAIARALTEHESRTVGDLLDAMARSGAEVRAFDADGVAEETVPEGRRWVYVGLERPDGLPEGTEVFTTRELGSLLPD
ncbi:TerD family protein [Nocardiopsis sp. EMB25]|uniref:TerD family protein n=1 Tax=Nocardiopsis sp. EMB25 TaxID=2835867 RepID=UPI002284DD4A|nr:TerD family protein [Nocardiopsis sp. EMB25]MCY9782744.1 TerD family protein [Nocardiopsis sp. EMB25]